MNAADPARPASGGRPPPPASPLAGAATCQAKATRDPGAPVVDNRAYVFAVLEATRRTLRRRDLHVAQSLRFADPARGLLVPEARLRRDGAAWEAARPAVLRALGRAEDGQAEITVLAEHLDAAYRRALANLPGNPNLRFEGGAPVLSRLDRLEEPDSLIGLRTAIAARLPKADLPEIVLEIMARTGFAAAFTHPDGRPARVEGFEVSLAAVLLAEACNVGLEPMIRSDVP